ncbi:hypothetical protein [Peribacillus sp. SCS-155]|uniref:hypothetical protein n=1 Tax=Peribacillus sedimenti TaxID=3115297 RepID=UPI0039063C70
MDKESGQHFTQEDGLPSEQMERPAENRTEFGAELTGGMNAAKIYDVLASNSRNTKKR